VTSCKLITKQLIDKRLKRKGSKVYTLFYSQDQICVSY